MSTQCDSCSGSQDKEPIVVMYGYVAVLGVSGLGITVSHALTIGPALEIYYP